MPKKKKRKLTAWQKHVKSYMASHPGLSFKEALPKAKLTYGNRSPKGTNRSRKTRRKSNPIRRVKKTARRRKRRSSIFSMNSVFKYLRIGSLVVPRVVDYMNEPNPKYKLAAGFFPLIGLEGQGGYPVPPYHFSMRAIAKGWTPFIATSLVTKGISKLMGIIKRL